MAKIVLFLCLFMVTCCAHKKIQSPCTEVENKISDYQLRAKQKECMHSLDKECSKAEDILSCLEINEQICQSYMQNYVLYLYGEALINRCEAVIEIFKNPDQEI